MASGVKLRSIHPVTRTSCRDDNISSPADQIAIL